MMRFPSMAAAAVAMVLTGPAIASPQSIMEALGTKPATLLDLSLARLQALINADGVDHGYLAWIYYQDGEILISAGSDTLQPSEAACRGVIDRIKLRGEVDPSTGLPNYPASTYAALFSYPRLDEMAIEQTYAETVDSMFRIRVTLGVVGDGQAMTCSSRLLSGDVTFERQ